MQFCEICGNILLPIKNKNQLYCKVCDKEFSIGKEKEKLSQYKRKEKSKRAVKRKANQRALKTAIVVEDGKKPSISKEDRAAFEELFEMSEGTYD